VVAARRVLRNREARADLGVSAELMLTVIPLPPTPTVGLVPNPLPLRVTLTVLPTSPREGESCQAVAGTVTLEEPNAETEKFSHRSIQPSLGSVQVLCDVVAAQSASTLVSPASKSVTTLPLAVTTSGSLGVKKIKPVAARVTRLPWQSLECSIAVRVKLSPGSPSIGSGVTKPST
jgi:hypothetical protein